MEENRKEMDKLRDQEYAMVYKAMDRRQVTAFKKMQGKPFDVDSIMNGFFRGGGPGGQNRPGGPNQNNATSKANTSGAATAKAAPVAKADPAASAASKSSTTPRRQSLRERRGLGQSSAGNSPN
jgi:hypothetical protein